MRVLQVVRQTTTAGRPMLPCSFCWVAWVLWKEMVCRSAPTRRETERNRAGSSNGWSILCRIQFRPKGQDPFVGGVHWLHADTQFRRVPGDLRHVSLPQPSRLGRCKAFRSHSASVIPWKSRLMARRAFTMSYFRGTIGGPAETLRSGVDARRVAAASGFRNHRREK